MVKFEFDVEIGCGRISVVKFDVVEFGGGSTSGGSCLLAE